MSHAISTLTMQDIADLAHVQRPAVSMWRKRPRVRGRHLPFPKPVSVVDGIEHFAGEDIVAWLEATGRGNNAEARYDVPAVTVPPGVDLETLVVLLCVQAATGEQLDGLSHDRLIDLARDSDPTDEYLLTEVVGTAASPLASRFIDELVEASFGADDALTRLESGRLKRQSAERGLTKDVIEMVRAVVAASRAHLGYDDTALVHGDDRDVSLTLAADFGALYVPDNGPDDRAVRRRAVIAGVDTALAVREPSVRVPSVVGMGTNAALQRIDEVILELGPQAVAVILGSASVLCDQLRGDSERLRAETLRTAHLMMAARLPRGLWREAHRQSLGLWVLHGGKSVQRPRLADLAAVPPGELDLDDLIADVIGALEATDDRAFRYCRLGDLAAILAGGSVVPRGVRAIRIGQRDETSRLDRIHAATLITSTPLAGHDVLAAPAAGTILLRHRSIGELHAAGHVAMKRGSRIDARHSDLAGTVAVASADGSWDGIRLDLLDAEDHYPRAIRTEPGDVVFLDKPRPTARVETEGGALVASPSRILRLNKTAEIGPYALAAIINETSPDGSEWQTWSVPVLARLDAQRLDAMLRDTHHYQAELRRRVDATHDLISAVIDGVAAGAVTLDAAPTTAGIAPTEKREG